MANSDPYLLRGTLDLLILRSLTWGPRHGYGISEWLEATTDEQLRIVEGTIYPALHRMEKRGWIEAEWGPSDNNRRAKFYRLTTVGRQQLTREVERWHSYVIAIGKVLSSDAAASLA